MFRGSGSRGRSEVVCLLALASLSNACKKHQNVSISAPAPTPQRAPKVKRTQTTTSPASSGVPVQPRASGSNPSPAEAPHLGQILSDSEERQYNTLIDRSLTQTQNNLNLAASRTLTSDQQSNVREIQEFMRQANAARRVDLISARALAEKAQILARDLVGTLK